MENREFMSYGFLEHSYDLQTIMIDEKRLAPP